MPAELPDPEDNLLELFTCSTDGHTPFFTTAALVEEKGVHALCLACIASRLREVTHPGYAPGGGPTQ